MRDTKMFIKRWSFFSDLGMFAGINMNERDVLWLILLVLIRASKTPRDFIGTPNTVIPSSNVSRIMKQSVPKI